MRIVFLLKETLKMFLRRSLLLEANTVWAIFTFYRFQKIFKITCRLPRHFAEQSTHHPTEKAWIRWWWWWSSWREQGTKLCTFCGPPFLAQLWRQKGRKYDHILGEIITFGENDKFSGWKIIIINSGIMIYALSFSLITCNHRKNNKKLDYDEGPVLHLQAGLPSGHLFSILSQLSLQSPTIKPSTVHLFLTEMEILWWILVILCM